MMLPLAADPTSPTPGMWIKVDLLRAAASPGSSPLRALILSPQATVGGDITDDTEIRSVNSAEDVETAAGKCLGYFAYKALLANYKTARVDIVCPAPSAGAAATGAFTFTGAPTADMTFRFMIQGTAVDVAWLVGEAVTDARDRAVSKIAEKQSSFYLTAAAGAAGAVDVIANGKGPAGNDIVLSVQVLEGAGGACAVTAMSGGTTEPDFTNALAAVEPNEYDYIIPCISNAEAQSNATSNQSRVETHLDDLGSGLDGKLQQAVVADTGSVAASKTGAIGRNSPVMEHFALRNAQSLPCEFAAAEAGDRMRRRALESNANRIGSRILGVVGSNDVAGDAYLKPTETDDLLNNGVTPGGYDAEGNVIVIRPITTHSQDSTGAPDKRVFDVNEVDALFDYFKDLRTALPQEFQNPDGAQVKIAKNRQEGDDELPEGVVEERDVLAFIVARTDYWIRKGVINGTAFAASVADGSLIVQVDDADDTQVDIFIPAVAYKVLSKFSLYGAKAA